MTWREASLLIPVYIHSKLRYLYAATTFTKKECNKLDKTFCPIIIAKMGLNRHTKLEILHGSYWYGGLQIPTSWDLQGSLHLHLLVGHIQLEDLIGQHLLHNIDCLYLFLGIQKKYLPTISIKSRRLLQDAWLWIHGNISPTLIVL